MAVVLNESALAVLLNTPDGPVGLFVARKAEEVVAHARANLRDYFHTAVPKLTVDDDVGFQMDGSAARIGIRDGGSKSRRMAQAQAEGRVNWLKDALEAARAEP